MRVKTCYALSACHWDPVRIAHIGFVFGKPQESGTWLAVLGTEQPRETTGGWPECDWTQGFAGFMLI